MDVHEHHHKDENAIEPSRKRSKIQIPACFHHDQINFQMKFPINSNVSKPIPYNILGRSDLVSDETTRKEYVNSRHFTIHQPPKNEFEPNPPKFSSTDVRNHLKKDTGAANIPENKIENLSTLRNTYSFTPLESVYLTVLQRTLKNGFYSGLDIMEIENVDIDSTETEDAVGSDFVTENRSPIIGGRSKLETTISERTKRLLDQDKQIALLNGVNDEKSKSLATVQAQLLKVSLLWLEDQYQAAQKLKEAMKRLYCYKMK